MALQLIEQGNLGLHDKIRNYLPNFQNPEAEQATVWHLLTHTLNFDFALSDHKDLPASELLNFILKSQFKTPPGTVFHYSNANSILLGMIVEQVTGAKLDALASERFFLPLGMTRTTFHPLEQFSKEEIVPTEICPWRGRVIQGEVHDESAWVLKNIMVPGSAGLFSTVPDLLSFMEMLLASGEYHGQRFFAPETVGKMYENQLAPIGASAGLGWGLNEPRYMGRYAGATTFGKTGFTGCLCLGDVNRGVVMVLLANYTYPQRKPRDSDALNEVRRDIADIVFAPY
jgi:CubicO group peptidase (beta-lactamase class C family)